jgi:hypothetical protein
MNLIISLVCIHWGFATGGILAMRTDWSLPRFVLILLLIKYLWILNGF